MKKFLNFLVPESPVLIFLLTFSITGVIFSFLEGIGPEIYKDCGVVREKIIVPGGSRSSGDLFLGVDFENNGFKAIEVSAETYMQYKPGNRVCFWMKPVLGFWESLRFLAKFLACLFVIFYLFYNVFKYLTEF